MFSKDKVFVTDMDTLVSGKQCKVGESLFLKNKVFAANMDNVPNMLDYIDGFINKFTPRVVFDITLACEEILINIVNYAYPDGGGKLAIAMEEDAKHHKLRLVFEDSGIPFNPLLSKVPDVSVSLGEREVGGLGIVIIRGLMDDIQYTYENGKNRLIITKEY